MKRIIIYFVMLIFLYPIFTVQAQESHVLEKGGVKSSALANANSSRSGESEFFTESPASPADLERPVLSVNYGDILGYNNFVNLSYSHPTLRGIISGNLKYFNANEQNIALDSAFSLNLNFSKIFTEKLFIGIGANFLKADYFNDNGITFGLNLGAIYHIYKYNKERKNKTLKNVKIGVSLLNIGTALYNLLDEVISPPIKLKIGPTFLFNLTKNIENSSSIDFEFRKFNDIDVNIGLENIFYKKYILRLGYSIDSDYQNFSFGAGYKFKIKDIDTEADYSLVALKNDKYVHYLGMEMRFGSKDTTPPETKIDFNLNHVSPNYDGKADYLEIKPEIDEDTILKAWEVKIVNKNDKLIKKFKSPDLDILKGKLTIKKIFAKLFEKKKEAPVPDKIVWDGIDEKGKDVPDGQYKVILTAYDEKLNKAAPIEKTFNIDKTPPEINITPEYKIFSPNADGVKDSVKFSFDLKTENNDQWNAKIINSKKEIIKEYNWKGKQIQEIVWDGKDQQGNLVSDGNYDLIVKGTDLALNDVKGVSYGITLTTAKQSVAISSSFDEFSPNNDKIMDTATFELYISDNKGLEKWKVTILNETGEEVKAFTGNRKTAEKIQWNGKDNKGKVLTDDDYLYKFEAWYDSGNHPESFPKTIKIDNTAPEVDFNISPDVFSPDEDETDDMAIFNLKIKDKTEIKDWKLVINEINKKGTKKEFKKFKQSGRPGETIIWNGLSDNGKLVQSKNKYILVFQIKDKLGNKTVIKEREITISKELPDVDFEHEPELFSPDDDGENDLLNIKMFSYNNKKIKSWKLNIYPIRGGKRESLFINYSGIGLSNKPIIWDGYNLKGELVESAMDYDIELIVEDILGNIKIISKILNVDVLVIKTEYGLKIKISNIEFEYNKADLRGNAFKILDRVTEILEKYSSYKVRIEGHTDNIGKEEYNLKLSEKRAKSVFDYLIDNGIKQTMLTIKGLGFSRPVAPNNKPDGSDNPEGRAKNRRVEFLLIKPGAQIKAK